MNKLALGICVFLIIGGLMIKYDTDEHGGNFLTRFASWVWQIAGNVRGITAHVASDYQWLPNVTPNSSVNATP